MMKMMTAVFARHLTPNSPSEKSHLADDDDDESRLRAIIRES